MLAKYVVRDGAERKNAMSISTRIDGVVVGDSLEQGIVRGNVFVHPMMRIALEFPDGWEVANSAEQVMAREPGTKHFMLLQMVEQPRGTQHRRGGGQRDAAGRLHSRSTARGRQLGGLDAYVGVYRGSLERRGQGHDARGAHRDGAAGVSCSPASRPRRSATRCGRRSRPSLQDVPRAERAGGGAGAAQPSRSTRCGRATRGSRSHSGRGRASPTRRRWRS